MEVVDGPVEGVQFAQYRADVRVNVRCIDGCQDAVVTMTTATNQKMTRTLESGENFAVFQSVLLLMNMFNLLAKKLLTFIIILNCFHMLLQMYKLYLVTFCVM